MEHSLKKYNVLIVGAGELGSRHLQGILKINLPIFVDVLDTNIESLEKCKLRAIEVNKAPKIIDIAYHLSNKTLSKDYDLCIIATTSNVRLAVIDSIVKITKCKFFVLEKVLFQKVKDFELALEIFKENDIKAWINCPRRTFELYENIKSKISKNETVTISILGGEWGLACNAIHYIDLFSFLTESNDFSYDLGGITKIVNSKRAGFFEFGGSISIQNSKSSQLILHSRIGNKSPSLVNIITDNNTWIIDEANGEIKEYNFNDNWELVTNKFEIPYQSNLTNILSEEILTRGTSSLPEFTTTEFIHKRMIEEFTKIFKIHNFEDKIGCPIT